jgi:hypothetical protein
MIFVSDKTEYFYDKGKDALKITLELEEEFKSYITYPTFKTISSIQKSYQTIELKDFKNWVKENL